MQQLATIARSLPLIEQGRRGEFAQQRTFSLHVYAVESVGEYEGARVTESEIGPISIGLFVTLIPSHSGTLILAVCANLFLNAITH